MGGGVDSSRGDEGGLPEICRGPVGGLWESYFWVGLLDSKECKQSLEPGVDDQEWLHQDIDFNSESPV